MRSFENPRGRERGREGEKEEVKEKDFAGEGQKKRREKRGGHRSYLLPFYNLCVCAVQPSIQRHPFLGDSAVQKVSSISSRGGFFLPISARPRAFPLTSRALSCPIHAVCNLRYAPEDGRSASASGDSGVTQRPRVPMPRENAEEILSTLGELTILSAEGVVHSAVPRFPGL